VSLSARLQLPCTYHLPKVRVKLATSSSGMAPKRLQRAASSGPPLSTFFPSVKRARPTVAHPAKRGVPTPAAAKLEQPRAAAPQADPQAGCSAAAAPRVDDETVQFETEVHTLRCPPSCPACRTSFWGAADGVRDGRESGASGARRWYDAR